MIARRQFLLVSIASALGVTSPLRVRAQSAGKVWRIGYLGNTLPATPEAVAIWEAFRQTLQDRGYIDGKNLIIERRFAEGSLDTFHRLRTSWFG